MDISSSFRTSLLCTGVSLVNLGFRFVGQSPRTRQFAGHFEVSGRFPEAKSGQENSNGLQEASKEWWINFKTDRSPLRKNHKRVWSSFWQIFNDSAKIQSQNDPFRPYPAVQTIPDTFFFHIKTVFNEPRWSKFYIWGPLYPYKSSPFTIQS